MVGVEPTSESASARTFSERSLRFYRRAVWFCFFRASQAQRGVGYPVIPLCYRELTQSFPAYLAPRSEPAGEPGSTSLCGYYAANARLVLFFAFKFKRCPFLRRLGDYGSLILFQRPRRDRNIPADQSKGLIIY